MKTLFGAKKKNAIRWIGNNNTPKEKEHDKMYNTIGTLFVGAFLGIVADKFKSHNEYSNTKKKEEREFVFNNLNNTNKEILKEFTTRLYLTQQLVFYASDSVEYKRYYQKFLISKDNINENEYYYRGFLKKYYGNYVSDTLFDNTVNSLINLNRFTDQISAFKNEYCKVDSQIKLFYYIIYKKTDSILLDLNK